MPSEQLDPMATPDGERDRGVAEPDLQRSTTKPFDHARVEKAVYELLIAIGDDPERDGLRDTPRRVAHAYEEMFRGLRQDPAEVLTTTFELGHDEMVLVKDIELGSCC